MANGYCAKHGLYDNPNAGCDYCIAESMKASQPIDRKAELEKERDRWYGAAQERQIGINTLSSQLNDAIVDCAAWKSCSNAGDERISELKQQVANLEEYMLKGVAFRDELQSRLAAMEKVAAAARRYMASFDSPMVLVHDEMQLLENMRAALDAAKEGE